MKDDWDKCEDKQRRFLLKQNKEFIIFFDAETLTCWLTSAGYLSLPYQAIGTLKLRFWFHYRWLPFRTLELLNSYYIFLFDPQIYLDIHLLFDLQDGSFYLRWRFFLPARIVNDPHILLFDSQVYLYDTFPCCSHQISYYHGYFNILLTKFRSEFCYLVFYYCTF